jgi:anti-sigma B factor antagonist
VRTSGIRVLRSDQVHLNLCTRDLTVMSTVGRTRSRIELCGDLDIAGVPAFDLVIDYVLHDGPPRLDVDLAGMTFLSAAGIGLLEASDERCGCAGGRLRLRRADARVRRLLTLVGAGRLLDAD